MKINFAIICDNAFTDEKGRLNIVQTFDTIRASDFPSIHPRLTVVANFNLEDGDDKTQEYILEMSIKQKVTNKKIARIINKVTPSGESTKNIQFISYFIGLTLPREGDYNIEFEVRGQNQTRSTIPLFVERT